jgi:hypothetical protein
MNGSPSIPMLVANPARSSGWRGIGTVIAKDARLGFVVMLVAAAAVVALAIIESTFGDRQSRQQLPMVGLLMAVTLMLVPAWTCIAMIVGDANRRGALLAATLPLPGAVKWCSKAGIALACMAVLAVAHLMFMRWAAPSGTAWDHSYDAKAEWITLGGARVITMSQFHAELIPLSLSMVLLAWSFAASAIARGMLPCMVLGLALPMAAGAVVYVGASWLAGPCRSLSWWLTGFDPLLDGSEPALRFDEIAQRAGVPVAIGTVFAVGSALAWMARARITTVAALTRMAGRMLATGMALCVAGAAVAGAVAAGVATSDGAWQARIWSNRATIAGVAHAMELPTPDLLRELLAGMQMRPDSGAIAWKRLTQPPCAWEPGARAEAERGMGSFVVDDPALIAWAARMRERPDECRAAIAAATDRLDAMSASERIALASLVGPEAVGVQAMRALAAATDEGQRLQATYPLGCQWMVAGEHMRGNRSTGCIESEPAQQYVALVRGSAVLMSRMLRPDMPRTWEQPLVGDLRLVAIDTATADAARRALELPFPEVRARVLSGAQDGIGWVAPVRGSMPNIEDLAKPASAFFTVTGPDPWCALPVAGEGARR